MKVTYDVELPSRNKRRAEEYYVLVEFVKSEHKTMCIEYDKLDKAKSKTTTMRTIVKNNKMSNISFRCVENKVYIVKKDK